MSEYLTALHEKVRDCDYGSLQNSLLSYCIVAGVKSIPLRNKLLRTANLTLEKCVDQCEVNEFDTSQLQGKSRDIDEKELDFISKEQQQHHVALTQVEQAHHIGRHGQVTLTTTIGTHVVTVARHTGEGSALRRANLV